MEALYELAKTKAATLAEQTEKFKNEKELRENTECTFAPNLPPSQIAPKSGGNTIKGVDKTLNRINNARKRQEEVKKLTERGEPKSKLANAVMQFGLVSLAKTEIRVVQPGKKKDQPKAPPTPKEEPE